MSWVIYGAYGYTGQLIVEEALKRGPRTRQTARSQVWARAADPRGQAREAWLVTVERLLGPSNHLAGALTPAQAFGPDVYLSALRVRLIAQHSPRGPAPA